VARPHPEGPPRRVPGQRAMSTGWALMPGDTPRASHWLLPGTRRAAQPSGEVGLGYEWRISPQKCSG
jgi:hypothetical protein